MLIIFGIRRLRKNFGLVALGCGRCGEERQALVRVGTWFALFFIPVIPLHFRYVTACPNCRAVRDVPKAQVEAAKAAAAGGGGMPDLPSGVPAGWSADPSALPAAAPPPGLAAPAGAPVPAPAPPAGWYPDAEGGQLRWWDGTQWTEHLSPQR